MIRYSSVFSIAGHPPNAGWKQIGATIAGGNGSGQKVDQLNRPLGLYVDKDQKVIIADYENHRVVEWNLGDTSGRVVSGGNGAGNRMDQLDHPTDVIVDEETDSLIICDPTNRRVMKWSRQSGTTSGQTIIDNTVCNGLIMDSERNLYVTDMESNAVRQYRVGNTNGKVVAGGNGKGGHLNQLNRPTSVFVDRDYSVYVSDEKNHRVMKWMRGAKEGIVVAGGRGQGKDLARLYLPTRVLVDALGTIYVADMGNSRVMRWINGAKDGEIIVGGDHAGPQAYLLNFPVGLSFDRDGNLYIADQYNHRVQRFSIQGN